MSGAIHILDLHSLMELVEKLHLYVTCCFVSIRVLAAKSLQLKTVIIKLKPVLEDTLHV
jgi:hypothetical protein